MTRMKPLAALALATVLLAACSTTSSSSSTTAPTAPSVTASISASVAAIDAATYAASLCTSINDWQQSLADGNQTFQHAVSATPTPQDVKDALAIYLTSAVQDTQTMLDQIQALGAPAGAEDASAAMVTALTNVKTLFETVLSSVESLDTTNPASMATALTDLVPQLQQGAQDVSDAIAAIPDSELKTAIQNDPNCQAA
jgi:PBP1b-binding outer membrane lipoprotein LpoB